MTRQQALEEFAEICRKYEASNDNEVIGAFVLFENGWTKDGFFKWKCYDFDGHFMTHLYKVIDVEAKYEVDK